MPLKLRLVQMLFLAAIASLGTQSMPLSSAQVREITTLLNEALREASDIEANS